MYNILWYHQTSSQEPGNLLDELNSKLKSSEARRPSKPDMKQKVKHKKGWLILF